MNEMFDKALEKLNAGIMIHMGKYENAMKAAVAEALKTFAGQSEEFAQAIVQGGSFEDCMKAVAKCVKGNSISDSEAYGAAVRFYFPGAEIRVQMTIDLIGAAAEETPAEKGAAVPAPDSDAVIIDLSDFF